MFTLEYIESLKTENGGFTRETLAGLGVPWPPPQGWKQSLIEPGESNAMPMRRRDDQPGAPGEDNGKGARVDERRASCFTY